MLGSGSVVVSETDKTAAFFLRVSQGRPHTLQVILRNSSIGAMVGCGVGKGSRKREEWRPSPRFPVWVTQIFTKVWTATAGGEAEVGGGGVVGYKCLWLLRGEVWAIALG